MNRPAWRIMSEETREALADYAHAAWSGWMKYQFSKAELQPDGTWTMPAWAVERWQRQMNTPYAELPEEEKASDRKEADEMLAIVGAGIAQAVAAERARWHNIETTPAPNGIDVEGWDSQYKRPVIINSSFQAVSEEGEEKAWALWTEYQDDYPVSMGGTISHWRYIVPPEEAQP